LRGTKFGGGKAKAGKNSFPPTPFLFARPSENYQNSASGFSRKKVRILFRTDSHVKFVKSRASRQSGSLALTPSRRHHYESKSRSNVKKPSFSPKRKLGFNAQPSSRRLLKKGTCSLFLIVIGQKSLTFILYYAIIIY